MVPFHAVTSGNNPPLASPSIRGVYFPGGVAHPGLPPKVGRHRLQFGGIDGGADQLCNDLQQIVARFDDIDIGNRIVGGFELLHQAIAHVG